MDIVMCLAPMLRVCGTAKVKIHNVRKVRIFKDGVFLLQYCAHTEIQLYHQRSAWWKIYLVYEFLSHHHRGNVQQWFSHTHEDCKSCNDLNEFSEYAENHPQRKTRGWWLVPFFSLSAAPCTMTCKQWKGDPTYVTDTHAKVLLYVQHLQIANSIFSD